MSRIRVLLADDQPIVRHGIKLLLQEDESLQIVDEASTGWEAIELTQKLLPDVVLMDIEMPGISGLDATKRIKELTPQVSLLMLTIHDREEFLFEALEVGALGYILKNATVEELMSAIRTVHSGDAFIYPRMATKLVGGYLSRTRNKHEDDDYERLSLREREVLPLLAESHTNQEIAGMLHLSPYTIQTYRQRIMRKLDLHSRTELLKYALRRKLIRLDPPTPKASDARLAQPPNA